VLKDIEVRNAKPGPKPYKKADAGGLYLYVTPAGSKLWRMKFIKAGKEKLLSFGAYPGVSLSQARAKRDEARKELRDGHDPVVRKSVKRAAIATDEANTFETLAREWAGANQKRWVQDHHTRILRCLEIDVFPAVGAVPIREIKPPHVLEILRKVEKRGRQVTAHLVRQRMSAVFVYAIATGRADADPAAPLKSVLTPINSRKQPAVTTLEEARQVIEACERVPGNPISKLCLRFLALTATRPVETRGARWEEFEIDDGQPIWRIPAERMKMRREHVVPLSRQAIEVLYAVREFVGERRFVFPGERHITEPVGESTLLDTLNRAGFYSRHVPHGWRSTFSTIMNERYPLEPHIIDGMLAHAPKNQVEARYNRAEYQARKRELAQEWGDLLLDEAKPVAELFDAPRKVRTDAVFRRMLQLA
jgi:integrase